jgi:hypothetical protein
MATVRLNTTQITDWASFHHVCKEAFGFPGFYGMNMNAWVDCMEYMYEDDGMINVTLEKGEMLYIEVTDTEDFNKRVPIILDALVECSAFVNQGYIEGGEGPVISLVFI